MRSDEEALVERATQGDRDAFRFLVLEHQGRVLRLCRALLDDQQIAEDNAQEALVRAWKQMAKLRSARLFLPWLLRIARNCCIDYRRKASRSPTQAIADEPADRRTRAADDSELTRILERELEQLTPSQAEVFRLYGLAKFAHEEIAEIRGCDAATSRALLAQARTVLRESKRLREFRL